MQIVNSLARDVVFSTLFESSSNSTAAHNRKPFHVESTQNERSSTSAKHAVDALPADKEELVIFTKTGTFPRYVFGDEPLYLKPDPPKFNQTFRLDHKNPITVEKDKTGFMIVDKDDRYQYDDKNSSSKIVSIQGQRIQVPNEYIRIIDANCDIQFLSGDILAYNIILAQKINRANVFNAHGDANKFFGSNVLNDSNNRRRMRSNFFRTEVMIGVKPFLVNSFSKGNRSFLTFSK